MPKRCLTLVLSLSFLALAALPAQAIEVQAGIAMVAVTGTAPGTEVVLEDDDGGEVRGVSDRFGSFLFRELVGGEPYTVRASDGSAPVEIRPLRFKDAPGAQFYQQQKLVSGFQYIKTRDGTLLAAMVRRRSTDVARTLFPTVVEYSGYAAADPDNPQPSTLLAERARLRHGRASTCAARAARAASSTSSTCRPRPTATT